MSWADIKWDNRPKERQSIIFTGLTVRVVFSDCGFQGLASICSLRGVLPAGRHETQLRVLGGEGTSARRREWLLRQSGADGRGRGGRGAQVQGWRVHTHLHAGQSLSLYLSVSLSSLSHSLSLSLSIMEWRDSGGVMANTPSPSHRSVSLSPISLYFCLSVSLSPLSLFFYLSPLSLSLSHTLSHSLSHTVSLPLFLSHLFLSLSLFHNRVGEGHGHRGFWARGWQDTLTLNTGF